MSQAAEAFLRELTDAGVTAISGVPCSSLGGLIDQANLDPNITYIAAANEGDAVAIAAGVWLGGSRGAVLMQNSGLGNAISPLTSLIDTCKIPMVMVIGWRGEEPANDEPQHALMGTITKELLRLCHFDVETIVATDNETPPPAGLPAQRLAFLVSGEGFASKRAVSNINSRLPPTEERDLRQDAPRQTRMDFLALAKSQIPASVAVMTTTGKCSREWFELGDCPQNFYQVGSMGCVSSVALGFASATGKPIVVIDGDGAALMRLGALATIGAVRPAGFVHILLDNEVHDSTGGQATVASSADLAGVARACGYERIARCDDLEGFESALGWAFETDRPIFIHAKIAAGSSANLGRPTLRPDVIAARFRNHFGDRR